MKRIYLDNAATTPVFEDILESIPEWGKEFFANPNSIHSDGQKSKLLIDQCRRYISSIVGCEEEEIIFTSCATESNNTIIRGLAESYPEKNEIIVSPIEHKSVLMPVKYLSKKGYKVHFLKVDKDGVVDINQLKDKISPRTLFVSVIHVNNETGVLQDIKTISRLCKEREVIFFSDTVQSFMREEIPEIDFFPVSGHKINAPKGIGFLKRNKNISLSPLILGGGQEFRLRSGTQNVIFIKALTEAVKRWEINKESYLKHLKKLKNHFIKLLKEQIPDVHIVSENVKTSPHITTVILPKVDAQSVIMALNSAGIDVSSGSACSSGTPTPSHVLLSYGYSEEEALRAVRFSFGIQNSVEEIEETVLTLKKVLEKLSLFF